MRFYERIVDFLGGAAGLGVDDDFAVLTGCKCLFFSPDLSGF